ncbi:MAG: hypothetical protein JXR76_07050 [Deltaproteobacteria bacterium]|nr:hypothetical protein [Deltaproteobacteria bacterium]
MNEILNKRELNIATDIEFTTGYEVDFDLLEEFLFTDSALSANSRSQASSGILRMIFESRWFTSKLTFEVCPLLYASDRTRHPPKKVPTGKIESSCWEQRFQSLDFRNIKV